MYRANNFSSTSAGAAAGQSSESKDANNDDANTSIMSSNTDVVSAEQHVVYLKSKGYFLNRKATSREGGRVMTMWNYPLRNKLWSFSAVSFHPRTGSFALADERGQVYKMSMSQFVYESVRLASTTVSALCFLAPKKNHLVIAYENSTIVIIDAYTKEIQGNIHLPHSMQPQGHPDLQKPFAKLIRSHPTKDMVIVVTNDMTVHLWNLTTSQCTQSLECNEDIVDVRFEMHGNLITICLEKTGVYIYATESLQLVGRLDSPSESTGRRRWTAYACIPYRTYDPAEKTNKLTLNIILSSNDNKLFSWYVGGNSSEKVSMKKTLSNITTHLFGYYDLPGKLQAPVNMAYLGDVAHAPRLALLSSDGGIIILESQAFQERSAGFFSVVADILPEFVQYDDDSYAKEPNNPGYTGRKYPVKPMNAVMEAAINHLVVISTDGAARLFEVNEMIGSGSQCGKILKIRPTSSKHIGVTASADSGKNSGEGAIATKMGLKQPANKVEYLSTNQQQKLKQNKENIKQPKAYYESDDSDENGEAGQQFVSRAPPSSRSGSSKGSPDPNVYEFYLGSDDERALVAEEKESKRNTNKTNTKGAIAVTKKTPVAATNSRKVTNSNNKIAASSSRTVTTRGKNNKLHSFLSATSSSIGRSQQKQQQQSAPPMIPLFELANLTPKEKRVNEMKLQAFLQRHGEYPAKYRTLIWRFLLKLPENTTAFTELVKRGIHPSFEDLQDMYPIQSRKIFCKLQNLCSQLAHWAPIMSEASYLPTIAFPFVLMFSGDDMAALEMVMTIMMYWGHSWHVTHPNPPIHIIDTLNSLLKLHDIKLYQYLNRFQLVPGIIAWQLLSSLFTEVASRNAWLVLMDYLFTYFTNVCKLILTPIALMKDMKSLLFSSCDTKEKIVQAFQMQQNLRVEMIKHSIEEMLQQTPVKYFSGVVTRYIDNTRLELGADNIHDTFGAGIAASTNSPTKIGSNAGAVGMQESDEVKVNLALANGIPKFPVPIGVNYPIYDGFPNQLIDMQIKERNKVLALQKEMKRKEVVLKELENKVQSIENEHQVWLTRHRHQSELIHKQRQQSIDFEKKYLQELTRIEEEISSQRIRAMEVLEHSNKAEIAELGESLQKSAHFIEENEQFMKEKMEMMINVQKYRELSEQAEVSTMEKLRNMRMRRSREEWMKSVAGLVMHKEEELGVQDRLTYERWKKEDEELRMQREIRQKTMQEQMELDHLNHLQEEVNLRMQKLQVEREAKLLEIERVRSIRLAQEQASEALESAERSALLLKKQQLLANWQHRGDNGMGSDSAGADALSQAAMKLDAISIAGNPVLEKAHREYEANRQHLQATLNRVNEESHRLFDSEKVYHLQQLKAQQIAKEKMLQEQYVQKLQESVGSMTAAEKELQDSLMQLQLASDYHHMHEQPIIHPRGNSTTLQPGSSSGGKRSYQGNSSTGIDANNRELRSAMSSASASHKSKKQVTVRDPLHGDIDMPTSGSMSPMSAGMEVTPPKWTQKSKRIIPTDNPEAKESAMDVAQASSNKRTSSTKQAILDEHGDDYIDNDYAEMMPLDDAMQRASKMLLDDKDDLLSTGPLNDSENMDHPSPMMKTTPIPPTWMVNKPVKSSSLISQDSLKQQATLNTYSVARSSSNEALSSPRKLLTKHKQNSFQAISQQLQPSGSRKSGSVEDVDYDDEDDDDFRNLADADEEGQFSDSLNIRKDFSQTLKRPLKISKGNAQSDMADLTLDSDSALWAFEEHDD